MQVVSVRTLFAGLDAAIEGEDVEVCALTCDSRQVTAGACFASLPGARADGHAFVAQAIERGAASILCERPVACEGATRVLVEDARYALAQVARRFFGDPSQAMCMVGVTGTNGKTTTTRILQAIFLADNRPAGVIGTLGAHFDGSEIATGLTTPESVDLLRLLCGMRDGGAVAVAMEVSSHALVQHRVAGVDFDVGVFLNLTHDHLDYHGNMEAYFAAKARLFRERLKAGGRAVVNVDDPFAHRLLGPDAVGFSVNGDSAARVRLVDARIGASATELRVATPRGELQVSSPLLGRFNVENLLAAIAVAEALELPQQAIKAGLLALPQVPGRLQPVREPGAPLVLVDYAHTPDALTKVLAVARELCAGRLICVFGCGGDRDPNKRAPMGEAAARLADALIITNDNPRSEDPAAIAEAIEHGVVAAGCKPAPTGERGYSILLDRARAIAAAVELAEPEDVVVVAGKGHETYQIVGANKYHFDDCEQARIALASRKAVPAKDLRNREEDA